MDIVLVVNDEPRNLVLVTTHLLLANHQVVTASAQKDAVELARILRPRLIVMDLVLANGDGWAAMQQIQEDADIRDIPVVVVSARSEPADVEAALAAGARDYLRKPYSANELKELLVRNLVN